MLKFWFVQFTKILILFPLKGVDPKRLKTSALMRRKKAGLPLEDNEYIPLIKRGSRQWVGVPVDQLTGKNRPAKPQLSAAITTGKTTLAHQALVDSRDQVYKVSKQQTNRNNLAFLYRRCDLCLHSNSPLLTKHCIRHVSPGKKKRTHGKIAYTF